MYLDSIHTFETGIRLEISTSAIRALVADACMGRRLAEIARIRRQEDICANLMVTVHEGAEGLVKRRRRWAGAVRGDILARRAVSFAAFSELFWRDIEEEDRDGDEWYRLVGGEGFAAEVMASLDKVRSLQRSLHRSTDILIRMNWGSLNGDCGSMDSPAF